MWGLAERKPPRFGNNFDVSDVYDELDRLSGLVQDLSRGVGKKASHSYGRARDLATETAHEAEEAMKNNLAASLMLTLGIGVAIGYFIRRSRR